MSSHVWVLLHDKGVWGVYSTADAAIVARKLAAAELHTTVYDDRFNIVPHKLDWKSNHERNSEMTRTVTIGPEFFGNNFVPNALTRELKAHGFKFVRETCPIKFAGTVTQTLHDDGSVTFTQTGAEQ